MTAPRTAFGLLLALAASSCVFSQTRVNTPIAPEGVEALELGITAGEVVQRLGAPTEVLEIDDGSAYRFEYVRSKDTGLFLFLFNLSHKQTRSDRVWCFFNEREILTHVGTTFEAADVEHKLW